MEARLEQVLSLSDPKESATELESLSTEFTADQLQQTFTKILTDERFTQSTIRLLITSLTKTIIRMKGESFESIALIILPLIKQYNILQLDESEYMIRNRLFDYYISNEQFIDAAHILGGVNLDSTMRPFTDVEKVDILIKCAGEYMIYIICIQDTYYTRVNI